MTYSHRIAGALLISTMPLLLAGCSASATPEQAEAAARSGDYETAIKHYSELAITSKDPGIFGNRGNCYSHLGNLDAALADYQTALDLIQARSPSGDDPILPYVYYNRATAYQRAKKYALAVADCEKTLEIDGDYPDVKNHLAWLLATCPDANVRNVKRAVELAEQELRRAPDHPAVLDTVAACYAAAGNFDQAVAIQKEAMALLPAEVAQHAFGERLELYRNQQPFIDSE